MDLVCPALIADAAPALCRQFDVYCERIGFGLDAEPLNALTNVAMLVVAAFAARLQIARPNRDAAGLIWAAIIAVALGGIGATLFHTTATVWAVWADMMPFLVFMMIILWLALTRHFGWPAWAAVIAVLGFLAITFGSGPLIPRGLLPGGAYYLPPLLVLFAVAVILQRRGSKAGVSYLLASIVFLGALAARESDGPLCAAIPFGTHFLWHLLAALLAWILIRSAILDTPASGAATRKPRRDRDKPA
ncbi:ceramidase domain-containing protein [Bauldia litoralis]|uniref:Ceramidase n=1 Tax=Bauldia litoralis TaxID=665467 RepID=A0A1G6BQC0_9HYPH|nr:ceramidase domain-containing protein [Bauldia litoralis]SDB22842.1 Ceramidase [Bauldia litoralis]